MESVFLDTIESLPFFHTSPILHKPILSGTLYTVLPTVRTVLAEPQHGVRHAVPLGTKSTTHKIHRQVQIQRSECSLEGDMDATFSSYDLFYSLHDSERCATSGVTRLVGLGMHMIGTSDRARRGSRHHICMGSLFSHHIIT